MIQPVLPTELPWEAFCLSSDERVLLKDRLLYYFFNEGIIFLDVPFGI